MNCKWSNPACAFETITAEDLADHMISIHKVTQPKHQIIAALNSANARETNGNGSHKPESAQILELGKIVMKDDEYEGHPMLILKWDVNDDRSAFQAGGAKWEAILAALSTKEGWKKAEEFVKKYQAKKTKKGKR